MSRVIGTISIDFETGEDITQKQLDKFEWKILGALDEFIEFNAEESGFESIGLHPALLDSIDATGLKDNHSEGR